MKLSIIFSIIFGFLSHSQNYQEQYKADICNCIEIEKANVEALERTYNKCFKKNITRYAPMIDAEIQEDNKTQKYIEGQKARRELQQKFKHELVYSCDYYFNTINNARQLLLKKLRDIPIDESKLEEHNQNVAMKPNWQNHFARANLHFKLGNLKEAEQDLRASLEINPYSKMALYVRKEMLLLAWVLEEQNRHKEAINIYDNIINGKMDSEIETLKAIVIRRAGGGNSLVPTEAVSNNTISKSKKEILTSKKKTKNVKNETVKSNDSNKSLRKLFKFK